MRILFCSPIKIVGGISRWTAHILNYYTENASKDIELVQYYSETKSNFSKKKNLLGRIYDGALGYWPMCREIKQILKKQQFDLIHLCTSASLSLLKDIVILKIAKKYGVRSVLHFHFGRIPQIFETQNWEYKLLRRVLGLADRVIVIDQRSYDTLLNAGYRHIENLPNPLTPAVANIIEQNTIEVEARKIVFAGHVVPAKGVFELVRACKQIPNIKVNLLGSVTDEIKTQLEEEAGANHQWLNIMGEQPFETTIKEMMSTGAFVLPTYTEGFPNVIIESMACGCPIVTTDVGAIPEMLDIEHGANYGICVKPRQVKELREAIEKMLNDRTYALRCGMNAQNRVRELYSMPQVWNKMVDIWEKEI